MRTHPTKPLLIKRFVTGKWRENCYVLSDSKGDAVVVDPGGNAEAIIRYAAASKLRVRAIVNTHAHYDHVGAVAAIRHRFKTPFYLHTADKKLLRSANLYRKVFDGTAPIDIPEVDAALEKVKTLVCGSLKFRVISTPGHTPGSVCLLAQGNLFTGDLLFKGKVGRTDLPGGDKKALKASLKRLSRLPPDTMVYPGHGGSTTLSKEMNCA